MLVKYQKEACQLELRRIRKIRIKSVAAAAVTTTIIIEIILQRRL